MHVRRGLFFFVAQKKMLVVVGRSAYVHEPSWLYLGWSSRTGLSSGPNGQRQALRPSARARPARTGEVDP